MQSHQQYEKGVFSGKQTLTLAVQDSFGQQGWRLTAHKYYPKDTRDENSTYVAVHKDKLDCQEFVFTPSGNHYKISLSGNQFGENGYTLTCHKYYPQDKRDEASQRVFIHKEDKHPGSTWEVIRDHATGKFRVVLADGDFKGWYLTAHNYYENDKRDENSHFVFVHKELKDGQLFDLPVFASYSGKRKLTMALQDPFGQQGWKVTSHNYYPKDKRDDVSTYLFIHKDNTSCQEFNIIPSGSHYKLQVTGNDFNQAGHYVVCHNFYPQDKRDDWSQKVFVHKDDNLPGSNWDIVRDHATGKARVVLADGDFKGWYLTAHNYYENDKRDVNSHYLFVHKEVKDGQLWDI